MGEAQKNEAAANAKAEENRRIIRQQVNESYKPMIDPIHAEAEAKEAQAKQAEGKRDRILQVIHDMDRQNDQQIGDGVVEKALEEVIEKVRNQSVAEELDVEILSDGMKRDDGEEGGRVESAPVTALSARKYVPFDRAYDKITRVQDSPKAMERYEECRREYADVIQATTERLRKLWSPEKNRIKVNAEEGRLDPRNAYKLGLALKGANVDVSRVWKTITTKKDPRVAVSLLVDCSGSMSGQQIELAMKAACCLSEVMRALHIPHEIIGHTTNEKDARKLDMDGVDADRFSRFCPFQGYVFKEFTENAAPSNIFSDFSMDCNLDGEAVMWALKRLEKRKEKTKICIVMSDGMPHAPLSQIEELERHLFTVAKKAEALEKDGMYLYGLGIGEVRVKEFYKHHSILNEVKDLPVVTLDIVEYILTKMVGSL
jgi:cobalamin biosynthesis protein CobT